MKKPVITLDEKREIQLAMLKEVDAFCRVNDIRYSLSYGTLLGAVRHKGFIPWDDDMDIMMPLPDMLRFKKEFKSDLVCYGDVDNQKYYEFAHSKVINKQTYYQSGLIVKSYGVNIDLYPFLGLPGSKEEIDSFLDEGTKIMRKRLWLMKWRSRIVRRFPIKTLPLFHHYQVKYRDFLFQYPYDHSKYHLCFGGDLVWRDIFDFDIFENIIDMPFENEKFMAISCYDTFLTKVYGDYMTPPPLEQRHPYHGGASVLHWW